jgi:hypothetical protein
MLASVGQFHCPVCGHHDCKVLKQNSPAKECLPPDIVVPRRSTRLCIQCKTTFIPDYGEQSRGNWDG